MRKYSSLVFVLMLVLVLSACNSNKISKEGQLSLDYINNYINQSDVEVKKKFVEEHIHPDSKPLFSLGLAAATSEENKFKNPQIVETQKFEEGGEKGSATLLKGDGNKEIIVLIIDDKVSLGFASTANGEPNEFFKEMRKKFKAE